MTDSRAATAEAVEPIALRYEGRDGCPTGAHFLGRIITHTSHWTLANAEDNARLFVARVERGSKGYTGSLSVTGTDGAKSIRKVAGSSCDEVVRGLAMITAVAIDPTVIDARPDVVEDEPLPVPPVENAPPCPVQPAEKRSPISRLHPASPPKRYAVVYAEGGPGVSSALVGSPVTIITVEVGVRLPPLRRRWLAPSFTLGFRQSLPWGTQSGTGQSQFLWTAGAVGVCPVAFPAGESLDVTPCVSVDAGTLFAKTTGLPRNDLAHRFWLDVGLNAGIRWALSPKASLRALAGVVFPLTRDRFLLEDASLVSQAPPVGVAGELRFGWQL
ncbi:MAG: hypothetical protein BGO98_29700 [Myxococcales bacterium 68-20]|nr:hypothetical protein [Myxococcales bacterium]OJY30935.1 MAG: hypothetical protein BGO98_29700 [Myxococcales bacterium 68-20]